MRLEVARPRQSSETESKEKKNKVLYMITDTRRIDSARLRVRILLFVPLMKLCHEPTHWLKAISDGQTDKPNDGPTNKVTYRDTISRFSCHFHVISFQCPLKRSTYYLFITTKRTNKKQVHERCFFYQRNAIISQTPLAVLNSLIASHGDLSL